MSGDMSDRKPAPWRSTLFQANVVFYYCVYLVLLLTHLYFIPSAFLDAIGKTWDTMGKGPTRMVGSARVSSGDSEAFFGSGLELFLFFLSPCVVLWCIGTLCARRGVVLLQPFTLILLGSLFGVGYYYLEAKVSSDSQILTGSLIAAGVVGLVIQLLQMKLRKASVRQHAAN